MYNLFISILHTEMSIVILSRVKRHQYNAIEIVVMINQKSAIRSFYQDYQHEIESQNIKSKQPYHQDQQIKIVKSIEIGEMYLDILLKQFMFIRGSAKTDDQFQNTKKLALREFFDQLEISGDTIKRLISKLHINQKYEELKLFKRQLYSQLQEINKNQISTDQSFNVNSLLLNLQKSQIESLSSSQFYKSNMPNQSNLLYELQPRPTKNKQIQEYLKQLNFKTELNHFGQSFQLKVFYDEGKMMIQRFERICIVQIPENQKNYFTKIIYKAAGQGQNKNQAEFQAAKKLLEEIYTQNPKRWEQWNGRKARKGMK